MNLPNRGDVHLSLFNKFFVYVSYVTLLFFGHFRDFLDKLFGIKEFTTPKVRDSPHKAKLAYMYTLWRF